MAKLFMQILKLLESNFVGYIKKNLKYQFMLLELHTHMGQDKILKILG